MGQLRRRRGPWICRDRGAAMVEFVLIAPLLIMLVFAIIVFGLSLNIKQDLTRAAAEGARAGAVALPGDSLAAAQTACDEALARFFGGADTTCVPTPVHDSLGNLYAVEVTVAYTGNLAGNTVPFIGQVIPDTLASTAVARTNQS